MIRIGDKIRVKPTIEGGSMNHAFEGQAMIGKVVYIHPLKRFFALEFEAANGFRWRECYFYPRNPVQKAKPDGMHIKV